jgi:tRNA (cmo5U34)-methyltransferase
MKGFEFNSIIDFDNHISSSIHGYKLLYELIINISSFFIKSGVVIDIGCTKGTLIRDIATKYEVDGIGYDINDSQFCSYSGLIKQDITQDDFQIPKTSLVISVFTLQFIDINKRLELLKKIYSSLEKNGAFIFCEKETQEYGVTQEVFTFANYSYKSNNFTAQEILEKEEKLRWNMNTNTSNENLSILKQAGFGLVTPFFKSLHFTGYLCVK